MRHRLRLVAVAFIAMAAIQATGATAGAQETGGEDPGVHTVRPGESLWRVARVQFGARPSDTRIAQTVRRLAALNRLANPDVILPGTKLRLPRARGAALALGTGYLTAGGSRRVRALQRRLAGLGYRPGPVDGLYGPRTQRAVQRLQRDHNLTVDGVASARTLASLRPRASHDPAPAPATRGTVQAPSRASATSGSTSTWWLWLPASAVILALVTLRFGLLRVRRGRRAPAASPDGFRPAAPAGLARGLGELMDPLMAQVTDAPVQVAELTAPGAVAEPEPRPASPPALRQPELISEAMDVASSRDEAERVLAELEDVFTIHLPPEVLRSCLRLVHKGVDPREAALRVRFPGLAAAVSPQTRKEGDQLQARRRSRFVLAAIGTAATRLLIRGARNRR